MSPWRETAITSGGRRDRHRLRSGRCAVVAPGGLAARRTSTRSIRSGGTAMRRASGKHRAPVRLRLPGRCPVRLAPREHTAFRWLPLAGGRRRLLSPSNAEAILMLPHRAEESADAAARGHLQHPQGRAWRGATQAPGDLQPGPGHPAVRRRHRVPAGGARVHPATPRTSPLAAAAAGGFPRARGLLAGLSHNAFTAMASTATRCPWPVASHRHEDMSDHRFEQRGLLHGEGPTSMASRST